MSIRTNYPDVCRDRLCEMSLNIPFTIECPNRKAEVANELNIVGSTVESYEDSSATTRSYFCI